jgi:hypothetical protein
MNLVHAELFTTIDRRRRQSVQLILMLVRALHQSFLRRSRLSFFFDSSTIITAHDDSFLVQSVEPAAFIAGGIDIARSAPHTLLNQRDGLYTYLMAVFFGFYFPPQQFSSFSPQFVVLVKDGTTHSYGFVRCTSL